jgi:hypothetical protein
MMTNCCFTRFVSFALLLSLIFPVATSAQRNAGYELHFKNEVLQPEENVQEFIRSFSVAEEQLFDGRFFRIVQFDEIPNAYERFKLEAEGVQLLDYIPHFGYFAAFKSDFQPTFLESTRIRSILGITPAVKLASQIFEHNIPDHAFRGNAMVELLVSYFPNLEPQKVVNELVANGIQISHREDHAGYLHVLIPENSITALAAMPFVVYIEPVYPDPEPDNYTGRTLHRSNALANDFSTGRQYDGTGINVMLQDDGVIGPHIDYQGRIMAQYISYNYGDHGDHCAGIIMGGGNLDPRARGNAFGANIYVYGASPSYPGFSNIPDHYFSNEIRVSSTSYSNGCNAGYTTLARTMDQQIRVYPALMHVFSAGNSGNDNCGYGAGAGWGNITGGHKIGKNVIAVANLNATEGLSNSSSRGPAHDGRIKPEIAAKGTSVYSTVDPNAYGFKTGTSMSCPGVAGVITQLFHAYRDLNGGVDPDGGLLKAIVMNTAEDLGNKGPDFKFGFGRINGMRALKILEDNLYEIAEIEQAASNTHTFEVPENTAEINIMVYWTDYEATVNTNWALVNNLDMVITDPDGQTWHPWILSHFPHPDSLNKPATRGVDNRNNVEQVSIETPIPGQYTLTVDGVAVPQGPQKYYLIYDFRIDPLKLTYPLGGEKLTPGGDELIRWDAIGDDGEFVIEYSLDNGENWIVLKDGIEGNARYFDWVVPSALTGEAWMRISRNEIVSQTEAPMNIVSVPQHLTINWACSNALHLEWNEVWGATGYVVYKLGEKFMEPIGTTWNNSFIVQNVSSTQTHWFSVSAIAPDGAEGQRAIAIQKTPGTFDCHDYDAYLVDVPSVTWGLFQSCMQLSSLAVTMQVKNFGLEPIENPIFHFKLNDGDVVTEAYEGIIMPDSTAYYTFSDVIDISEIGSYSLDAWIEFAPDQNLENNQLTAHFEVIEGVSIAPGIQQTIEDFEPCLPAPICELYTCNLQDGWINLTNEVLDDIDWRTWSGSTYSFETGPSFDHTTGTAQGKYLYLEPSVGCFFKEAILSLPCVDLTSSISPALSLWYHAYGADMGRLHVDLFDGAQILRDIVEPVAGNQGDEWHELVVDLSPWSGNVIGLRIRGYTGSGEKSDLAIDDIIITDILPVAQLEMQTEKLQVYPNPANGIFNVSMDNLIAGDYNLVVSDIRGKIIYKERLLVDDNRLRKTIDLSQHPIGIYLLEVSGEKQSGNAKLQIRK